MDILDSSEESSTQKIIVVKDEFDKIDNFKSKGKSKGGKKGNKNQQSTTIQLIENGQEVKYEVEQDGSGVAVAYRVVELSPDLSTASPSISPTLYNSVNSGLCVLPQQIEVYPVNQTQKQIVPSTNRTNNEESTKPSFSSRDDRRRATHNEVERRRRDKINNWILKLSKLIPECKSETRKGTFESQSKGFILARACDYITELKDINEQLALALKQHEQLSNDMEAMSRKVKDISQENEILKATLAQHGLSLP